MRDEAIIDKREIVYNYNASRPGCGGLYHP